jgi:hypothetical protein
MTPVAAAPAWDSFLRVFHRPDRVDLRFVYPLPEEYLELEDGPPRTEGTAS